MGISVKDSKPPRRKTTPLRPLDMFLLGLIKGGLITPYDWQSRARISLGASLPAVKRLVAAGLLEKVANGDRGRHEFGLTSAGHDKIEALPRYLDEAMDHATANDLESVLRLACLATVVDAKKTAKQLLRDAVGSHRTRARQAKGRKIASPMKSGLAGLYSMALSQCEAAEQVAIAKQLESLHRRWERQAEDVFERWRQEHRQRR